MTPESEVLLYAMLAIPAIFVGFFLLLMGPIGWFLAAFLGIAVLGAVAMWRDSDVEESDARVNCPHCGARTSADGPCDYCGESF